MMGTAGAKKAGSTCNQLNIPYSEFGHQCMYCANMEETAIHIARVTGWKYAGEDEREKRSGLLERAMIAQWEKRQYCGCLRRRASPSGPARP